MPTNLAIDDQLLEEARLLGRFKTKRETVNEALKEYIQRRRRRRIKDLFGKIEMVEEYDYKSERQRR
ncbi:MAG: type II toxin-antitoxin system VapB family antitoxin [Deltaproteobacteria bacterium]|jgi:Arc/MetJ family transcription regulator|nr:type II toxin-antitoxin system VapB family antitoxin [Deltaproteobacteria bacterium]